MTDRDLHQLNTDVDKLRVDVDKKADSSALDGLVKKSDIVPAALTSTTNEEQKLTTQKWVSEFVAKETKFKQWEWKKDPEFIAFVFTLTALKLELMPLFSLEPVMERLLKKIHVERSKWGVLSYVRKKTRERRERESPEYAIRRLQDLVVSAHTKIGNSNKRISTLERKLGKISDAAKTARRQIERDARPGSTTTQAQQLQRLESYVTSVSRALG